MPREWFKISELIGLPGLPGSSFRVREWLRRNKVTRRPRTAGKGEEYHISGLPASAVAALAGETNPPDTKTETAGPAADSESPKKSTLPGAEKPLEALPETTRSEAARRAAACLAVRRSIDSGSSAIQAISRIAEEKSITPETLRKWWFRVRSLRPGEYAAALAPRRGGDRSPAAEFTGDAWEYLKADYLRPERPCLATCYYRLNRAAKENGWVVPSYRTCLRKIESLPWEMVTLAREGDDGLLRKLPVMTRTRDHLQALQMVNSDGHVFDVLVNLPSGGVGRPVLTAWQDLYSGKVLSWRVSETLNQHVVRLSFGDMVERYGVPQHAYLDNGREFANKWLTGKANFRFRFKIREDDPIGIFTQLGVEVHWTTPYHGQSKPIERCWRDLCEEISKHPSLSGAYTGNSPANKPANYGARAVDWDDFVDLVSTEITAHNARIGRRTETAKGRSFDTTFAESYARATVTRASEEQRRLWLLAAEGVRVRPTGHVAILGNAYWGEALPPLSGKNVVVRFDPEHLERPVSVYAPTGELLCEAARTIAAFDDAQAAKDHARANRHRIKAAKDLLRAERTMSAIEAAQILPNSDDSGTALSPGVVRMITPKRAAVNGDDFDLPISEETQRQEQAVLASLEDWAANRFALSGL